MDKHVVLVILDGWGCRKEKRHNAIVSAHKPNFDQLWQNYPHAALGASGEAIGLPEGQIGTSEANHLIIGSGRILYQSLVRINQAIKDNTLKDNEAIKEAIRHVKKYKSVLHIKGLVSPGGVHSHMDHMKAIIKLARDQGVKHIILHLITDGRDVLPKSANHYIKDLEDFLKTMGVGRIASVGGRYWGMDRDNNADRIEKHFKVMVVGDGPRFKSAIEILENSYKKGVTDEFIEPSLVETEEGEIGTVQTDDAVIFINFRADRAKQLTRRFVEANIKNLKYITMTQYADNIDVRVAFPPEKITDTLSEVLSNHHLTQLRVTETEKFAHVTFFLNAKKDSPDEGEDRLLIPSDKSVRTYDERPAMRVFEIASAIVDDLNNKKHDFIVTNLVNADMVGHTGNFQAIVAAVEAVDKALGMIVEAAQKNNTDVIITADHGNAEETYDEINKQPITAHTLNPVPFILVSEKYKTINHEVGLLSDVAPTILNLFGIKIPLEMTGTPFIP